ncbi:MAG: hypothetical protein ACIAXF_00185 [Phycisphaerales bacterium JB063]
MPNDPEQQLETLKRGLCGDCGVGPFRGKRPSQQVSVRAAVWLGLGLLALTGAGVGLLAWLGSG